MSRHLKKYAAPTTWPITRKDTTYITKPSPGPHSQRFSMSIDLILKILGCARTRREIKKILNTKEIIVDGKKVSEPKFPVGLFDTLSIPATNQHFRVVFDAKGRLKLLPIQKNETDKKIARIIGKTILKNAQMQLNLSDSRNILTVEKTYKVGDTLLIEVPSQKIQAHFRFEPGVMIYLVDGKYAGQIGMLEEIKGKTIMYTNASKQKVQTLKEYAYTIGKEKQVIQLQ